MCQAWQRTLSLSASLHIHCTCRWFVGSIIIGATSVEHAKENIEACLTKLDEDTLQAMDDLFIRHGNITLTD